jgi:hypothetical protein
VEKDASNYPTLIPPVIYISLSGWKNLETDKKKSLVLHEYLGILGLEKNNYRLSNLILSELSQIERENFNAENRVNVINKCNPVILVEIQNENAYGAIKELLSNYGYINISSEEKSAKLISKDSTTPISSFEEGTNNYVWINPSKPVSWHFI